MKIEVSYMSGAGNTFTVIDNRKYNLPTTFWSSQAYLLCSTNSVNKIATEGLLIINESKDNDFKVDFFNPDGSNGMMCGNGGRCAVFYAQKNKFFKEKNEIKFEMSGNVYLSKIADNLIHLYFPPPIEIKQDLKLKVGREYITGTYINVNSDHFCLDYKEFKDLQKSKFREFCIDTYAPKIRFNEAFTPRGVNVNFYNIKNRKTVELRTYERGVEAETGACGTGALSTALTLKLKQKIDLPIKIIPPSEKELYVNIIYDQNNHIQNLILTGDAEIKGNFVIEIPTKFISE